jgi:hypothetical protein
MIGVRTSNFSFVCEFIINLLYHLSINKKMFVILAYTTFLGLGPRQKWFFFILLLSSNLQYKQQFNFNDLNKVFFLPNLVLFIDSF